MKAVHRFFNNFRTLRNWTRSRPIQLRTVSAILGTTLGLTAFLTASTSAYDERSQNAPVKYDSLQVGQQISEKRTFILSRFDFVCQKLGMNQKEKELAFNSYFKHLQDDTSLLKVLNIHREQAQKVLNERGPAIFIDHTILKADATNSQVEALCKEAIEYSFGSVCVNGGRAYQAYEFLQKSNINIAAVIGFPLGASTTISKRAEATEMWLLGCKEIDMVIDVGRMKEGDYKEVKSQITDLVWDSQIFANDNVVKVIFETCLLTKAEIVDAAILSVLSGATVVKTSTGFSTGGATVEDVEMMRLVVGNRLGVKASGGVRDKDTMMKMIQSGASLIGTSSGVSLCKDAKHTGPAQRRRADHCFEKE